MASRIWRSYFYDTRYDAIVDERSMSSSPICASHNIGRGARILLVLRREPRGAWRATGMETPQRGRRWRGYCNGHRGQYADEHSAESKNR